MVTIDGQGGLLILVTKQNATLSAVATFSKRPLSLDTQAAPKLDGDVRSGIVIAANRKVEESGAVNGLVASAMR